MTEANHEPSLFDQTARTPTPEQTPAPSAAAADLALTPQPNLADTERPAEGAQSERKRLAEQLEALKRKESELRRALAIADHPELADSIRTIEGCAYALSRAETKLAQGFSKSEARRRELIEKKLGALREKRAELDAQIGALERELHGLGSDRLASFESERKRALEQLFIAFASQDAALQAAGLDASQLIPELSAWMPELEALAKTWSEQRPETAE